MLITNLLPFLYASLNEDTFLTNAELRVENILPAIDRKRSGAAY